MITGFTSIKYILSKVYQELGTNSEINELDAIEWAYDALSMIGAYAQYKETSTCLDLSSGKAKLPLNFHKLVDIRYKNFPVYWATNTNANNYQCSECSIPICKDGTCNYTFYINDSYIITNITDTDASVCVVYLGHPVDDEGYPMIPDDIYYMKAITSYIIHKIDKQEWRKGKLADKVYQESEKDWLFYVNSARGAANMPNLAQLENLKSVLQRLSPLREEYRKGFRNINKQERLNLK